MINPVKVNSGSGGMRVPQRHASAQFEVAPGTAGRTVWACPDHSISRFGQNVVMRCYVIRTGRDEVVTAQP